MSYIRAGWGLTHVKGASDSYVISTDEGIESYSLGNLGMMELLCEAINTEWKDDPEFRNWFKNQVAERLDVELREKPITFEQSEQILMGKLDAKTLEKIEISQSKEDAKEE
ncbi:MAG: hypothetical protein ACREF7_03205 [Candidatus Saccharimonadales bacterium]